MVDLIDTIVYAGRLKDKSALMSSSSGGAFTALSDAFLKSGDAVVAAVYNYENHTVEFQMILDEKQRERAKGSKYMQSKPGDIYQEAYHWLMDNPKKELLFVGMGCQSDGFRKFSEIKGIRDRVYIVDIICHGSPSPKLWREYAESIQKKDGRITYLTFKDKRNGWKSPTAYVKVNGSERPLKDYVKVFYNRCALRPSCYECPYATTERKTDMTIGDFWHIEETIPDFYDPNGNSLFLIHTGRGEELFEKIRDNMDYRLSNTAQCWQANLEAPTQKSEQRDVFWNDYQKKGIDFVIKKYGTVPMKTKVKNKLFKILRGGVRTK
jgi:coenzyme F420-reducing hydrogenase beta subunit